MNTPITYYGGKQRIAKWIVGQIPPHMTYAEPFAGGASVLFAKEKPVVSNLHNYMEALNDIRGDVITFYRIAKTHPEDLIKKLDATMYSSHAYMEAKEILRNGSKSDIDIAWAFYMLTATARAGDISGGYRRSKAPTRNNGSTFQRKLKRLPEELRRLSEVQVEGVDALKFIDLYDSPMTCFYIDPPYVGSHQGHYNGYEKSDLLELVDKLSTMKSSFVLSGYDAELFPDDWRMEEKETFMSARKDGGRRRELLWIVDRSSNAPEKNKKDMWSPSQGFVYRL